MSLKYKEALLKDLELGSVVVIPNQRRSLFLNAETNEIKEIQTIRIFRLLTRTLNTVSNTFTVELMELNTDKADVQPAIFEEGSKLYEVYEEQPEEQQPEQTVEPEVKEDKRKVIKG